MPFDFNNKHHKLLKALTILDPKKRQTYHFENIDFILQGFKKFIQEGKLTKIRD